MFNRPSTVYYSLAVMVFVIGILAVVPQDDAASKRWIERDVRSRWLDSKLRTAESFGNTDVAQRNLAALVDYCFSIINRGEARPTSPHYRVTFERCEGAGVVIGPAPPDNDTG